MKLHKNKVLDHYYFCGDLANITLGDGSTIKVDAKSTIEIIIKSVTILNEAIPSGASMG